MLGKGVEAPLPSKTDSAAQVSGTSVKALTTKKLPKQSRSVASKISSVNDARSADFPGATGPGSGARHFPSLEAERRRPLERKERKEKFEMKTTKDYYKEFPVMVRASMPLHIEAPGQQEPLGKLEQALGDAGPETGQRKKPEVVDHEGRQRPRMPSHPDTDRSDLLRERDTRHL